MSLTDAACRAMKATGQKQEVPDGRGLFLVVGTSGHKSWVLRFKEAGKSRRMTLGVFDPKAPDHLGLANARLAAGSAKSDLKTASTTATVAGEPESPLLTVSEAFAIYMRERWGADDRADADKRKRARWAMFERHFEPFIGQRPLRSLTKIELKTILRERQKSIISSGKSGRGIGNIQAEFSAFLSWCADQGEDLTGLEANVLAGVRKLDKAEKRKRHLSDDEIIWLLRSFAAGNGFAKPYEWVLRLGQRRTESIKVLRRDIVMESEHGPYVRLPRESTKNRKEHIVPLTPQMMALLPANLNAMEPTQRVWQVSAEGTSKSWGRVFERVQAVALADGWAETIERFSSHDFRRTCRTAMHSKPWRAAIEAIDIPRVFNHGATDAIDDTYNQWDYIEEKRGALQLWNDKLDRLAAAASSPVQKKMKLAAEE